MISVAGDGNCLFRSLQVAAGFPLNEHHLCRLACVDFIVSKWDLYHKNLSQVHADRLGCVDQQGRLVKIPFPSKDAYVDYMSRSGTYGSNIEADAFGKIHGLTVLIWSGQTHRAGLLINAEAFPARTVHILYNGTDHFNGLTYHGSASDEADFVSGKLPDSTQDTAFYDLTVLE